MTRADEFQVVTPQLAFWQAYEPAVKCELSSCAVRTPGGLVFVDPIELEKSALAELAESAPPLAIVLTNGNHARAAAVLRERFSIPVLAHADAVAELGIAVDRALGDDEEIAAGVRVLAIPGAGAGEIAVHFAGDIVAIGDALIHLEPHGFGFLPDKYCTDPRAMRAALRKLLPLDFSILTFAHGLPLTTRARPLLESLLA